MRFIARNRTNWKDQPTGMAVSPARYVEAGGEKLLFAAVRSKPRAPCRVCLLGQGGGTLLRISASFMPINAPVSKQIDSMLSELSTVLNALFHGVAEVNAN